jgi:hypothetical protein
MDQQLEAIIVFFSSKNEEPTFQTFIEGLRERILPKQSLIPHHDEALSRGYAQ